MKRVYKCKEEPEGLKRYRTNYPWESWEHFRRRARRGYQVVKQQILHDQHGLCAYCEISIKLAEEEGEVDDFRVEHFYPKSVKGKLRDIRCGPEMKIPRCGWSICLSEL